MDHATPNFDASQLKGLGITPLASLKKHRRAALIGMIVVILLGIPFAWIKGKPKYMTMATVQVAPRYMKNQKEDNELDFQSNAQYRQYVVHQSRSIKRYDILEQALKDLGDNRSVWQKKGESDRKAVERLQEQLAVMTIPDTYLLQIMLEDGKKEGLELVVNAVVDAYLNTMRDEQMYGSDERSQLLATREKSLLEAINAKTARRTTISLELGITSFAEAAGNPYDKILADSRSSRTEARRLRYAAEAKLQAYLAKGETDITTRSVQENILNDPGLNSFKSGLNNRRALLVTQLTGLTANHPAGAAARVELVEIDEAIKRQSEKLRSEVAGNLKSRYEMTVEQAQRYEKDLESLLKEQEAASANFARLFNEAVTLSNELAQLRKELEALRDRLNFFAAERGSIGFVRPVTTALPPDTAFGPGRKKLMILVLMAGGVLGLLIPIAIDMLDRRIRSVSDAERTLGLPSLGWLVERNGEATKILAADQMRRLAASLLRERERHGTTVFGLCGVKPGAGVSELTLELANTLTAMGFATLAVEANAFHCDPRFGAAPAGLAQALAGEVSAFDCVLPAADGLPARVRVGTDTAQRHLGSLQRLDDLLTQWRSQYSYVLVDMPSLLLSADAEILLNQIGQTLLVVEANSISKGELGRAARMLEKIAPKAVGVIVNRIETLNDGGYLREVMIEQISRKKFADFQTQPQWQLRLQMLLPQNLQAALHNLQQAFKARLAILRKRRHPEEKDPS